ncbi:MAG TPA: MarR family transcriptional regulator [Roseiflexaceae bacterium]|nr:MarR family transcriptional regulator [Roseiflexaceae bacterium]
MSDAAVLFHTALAEQLGLGPSDWKTMGLLQRHGPLTAGELSARSGLAPASVTGIIDRLERGGWVRRTRDANDGRRVVVTLDEEISTRNAQTVFQGLERRLTELYARYSDEQLELLLGFLREIAERQQEATAELTEAAQRGRPPA